MKPHSASRHQGVRFDIAALLLALGLACGAPAARAQADAGEPDALLRDEPDLAGAKLAPGEAARLLAEALPDEPNARYALLQRQYNAAISLDSRVPVIEIARQLAEAGRGRPGGEVWIMRYLGVEFASGSSGKALEACEPFIADERLSLATRTAVALRQTYYLTQGRGERERTERAWSRAESLLAQLAKTGAAIPLVRQVDRLQVRSEMERLRGDLAGTVATLRESIGVARRWFEAELARSGSNARDLVLLDAQSWLDGSQGMLIYGLVRLGRSQEAAEVSQARVAQWRAGKLSDGYGARWLYRQATALNSIQQYERALESARASDEILLRTGATPASHVLWLARQEVVLALMGLKRWQEADTVYRGFIDSMPADVLARTRASDSRVLILLAAKNGRLDEALDQAERFHRFRLRLYGARHPLTQEAVGVRGVVRLLRGDVSRAMTDYEELFAATLDNPGGWLDLGLQGFRGYVFGLAFDEFMRFVTERALKGEKVDPALADRAMQIADRSSLSVTQQALADSTARVLAATPALRSLIEQEQTQRQQMQKLFDQLFTVQGQEDRLRRETQAEAFKALPEAERRPKEEQLRGVREQIKTQQAAAAQAQTELNRQRDAIAKQYPAYADLVTPTTPKPDQLRRLLSAGEAVLVVQPGEQGTLVWLVGADGRTGFHASRATRTELAVRVTELRRILDLGAAPAGREPPLQAAALHALYVDLIGPLEPALRDVKSLIVATQGPLASLPFAALVTRAPEGNAAPAWLVRQMAVTQLPASSALLALRRVAQPQAAAKALLGFGDPLFNAAAAAAAPQAVRRGVDGAMARNLSVYDAEQGFRYRDVPPLPETRAELLAVAAALGADPKTDLVMGAQATRRAVLDANLLDRRVVAFATHGLMPGELPGVSKPALAMAADASPGQTVLLELDDVLGLRLNAQWVLLSACNTAAGEQGGGAMSGLVRGFFFAGTRSVLATHWAVESESAAALSGATFTAQAKASVSRAESLRQAQLAMIEGQLGAGRWNHPFYWAPYALFGDPLK